MLADSEQVDGEASIMKSEYFKFKLAIAVMRSLGRLHPESQWRASAYPRQDSLLYHVPAAAALRGSMLVVYYPPHLQRDPQADAFRKLCPRQVGSKLARASSFEYDARDQPTTGTGA